MDPLLHAILNICTYLALVLIRASENYENGMSASNWNAGAQRSHAWLQGRVTSPLGEAPWVRPPGWGPLDWVPGWGVSGRGTGRTGQPLQSPAREGGGRQPERGGRAWGLLVAVFSRRGGWTGQQALHTGEWLTGKVVAPQSPLETMQAQRFCRGERILNKRGERTSSRTLGARKRGGNGPPGTCLLRMAGLQWVWHSSL